MITSIKRIYGIGRYDKFNGQVPISKNQIIFGFNGSGKSTLSDILYSLSDENHCKKLMERKTLQKDDGTKAIDPEIILETNTGNLNFSDGKWNIGQNVYVFNDQYIMDYVTIITGHDVDKEQLVLGREGNMILRLKKENEDELQKLFIDVGNVIVNNKDITGNLGLGKSRITQSTKNWHKKITAIAGVKLYNDSKKEAVQKSLNNVIAFNDEYNVIQEWLNLLKNHQRYSETSAVSDLKKLEKLLKSIPNVTNKEIAEHISKYMLYTDVNWLVSGMNNRIDASHCPFCGQELKGSIIFFVGLTLPQYSFLKCTPALT